MGLKPWPITHLNLMTWQWPIVSFVLHYYCIVFPLLSPNAVADPEGDRGSHHPPLTRNVTKPTLLQLKRRGFLKFQSYADSFFRYFSCTLHFSVWKVGINLEACQNYGVFPPPLPKPQYKHHRSGSATVRVMITFFTCVWEEKRPQTAAADRLNGCGQLFYSWRSRRVPHVTLATILASSFHALMPCASSALCVSLLSPAVRS